MVDWLSTAKDTGSEELRSNSRRKRCRKMATISASHEERAIVGCFLQPQEMAALAYPNGRSSIPKRYGYWNTKPDVE